MTTDPIFPGDGSPPEPITSERIYDELRRLVAVGVLEYARRQTQPTRLWILGAQGQVIRLVSDEQAVAFLAGCSAMAHWAAGREALVP